MTRHVINGSGDTRPVTAVLFDLDGTLVNTIELILESFRYATRTVLGTQIADDELLHNVGVPLVRQMGEFDPDRVDELVVTYREHNRLHHDELAKEYPGTGETLEALESMGYPMGIVTSKASGIARRGLDLFGLSEYFSVMVCSDDVEIHKPDPYPLRYAAELLGVPIEECLYVGDSEHDMAAAVAAGAIPVAALWGPFPAERVLAPGAEYALDSIRQLPALLDGRSSEFAVVR